MIGGNTGYTFQVSHDTACHWKDEVADLPTHKGQAEVLRVKWNHACALSNGNILPVIL